MEEFDAMTGADLGKGMKGGTPWFDMKLDLSTQQQPTQQAPVSRPAGLDGSNQQVSNPSVQAAQVSVGKPTVPKIDKSASPVDQYQYDMAEAQSIVKDPDSFPFDEVSNFSTEGGRNKEMTKSLMIFAGTMLAGKLGGMAETPEDATELYRLASGHAATNYSKNGARSQRARQRSFLQAKGYTDENIQEYERSGDMNKLIKNYRENPFLGKDKLKQYFKKGDFIGRDSAGKAIYAQQDGEYERGYNSEGTLDNFTLSTPDMYEQNRLDKLNLAQFNADKQMEMERYRQSAQTARTNAQLRQQASLQSQRLAAQQDMFNKRLAVSGGKGGKINPATGQPVIPQATINKMYSTADDSLNALNKISSDDIENAGGVSSYGGYWAPGSRESESKINQVLSKEFMQGIGGMKGMGSLSNAEGSKITSARSALVDPETNTLRTGLPESFINEQIGVMKQSAQNMKNISQFYQAYGREPTLSELNSISVNTQSDPLGIR